MICPGGRRSAAAALRFDPDAIIAVLVDQPLISKDMIDRLILAYRQTAEPPAFVASGDKGKPKPPILFGKAMFDVLLRLEGDQRARQLLGSGVYTGLLVEEANDACFFDVDTPEDWVKFVEQWHKMSDSCPK